MAIAFVQKVTHFSASGSETVTSGAFGSATTTGNVLIDTPGLYYNSALVNPITASDNKGNTHTSAVAADLPAAHTAILWAPITSSGSGHTITIQSVSAGTGWWECDVCEFSGLLTTGVVDQTATDTDAAGDPSVTTGTTTQASELVVACMATDGGSGLGITDPVSGYTSIGVHQSASDTVGYEACYKTVSSTGAQSAAWTSGGTNSVGVIATFKDASSGGRTTKNTRSWALGVNVGMGHRMPV